MINVLVTMNRRAAVPVKIGSASSKEMGLLLYDWIKSTADTLVSGALELKEQQLTPDVMVTVTEAYMGDSAFAQIDLQFLFEPPQVVMERLAMVLGVGVEEIAKKHYLRSAIPTNVILLAWWASPEHMFRYESKTG